VDLALSSQEGAARLCSPVRRGRRVRGAISGVESHASHGKIHVPTFFLGPDRSPGRGRGEVCLADVPEVGH
ncbi:MAG: hypothetical protein AVDCRST_MAG90-53, partial [uncultured Microvirga sp.]